MELPVTLLMSHPLKTNAPYAIMNQWLLAEHRITNAQGIPLQDFSLESGSLPTLDTRS
jgi:hypothetical protein